MIALLKGVGAFVRAPFELERLKDDYRPDNT